MTSQTADYDSPWKDILEAYFEECIQFFFPDAYSQVDWSKGYEFLDKELQKVVKEAEVGRRYADKLVKVWTLTGEDIWVLVHIEVQSQSETKFAERMFTYYYRLKDRFNRPVVSFAILSDDNPRWRPSKYTESLWGCRNTFEFRSVKLLDYADKWPELETSDNPFSVVVMAHLKTLETVSAPEQRKRWKTLLAKGLLTQGRSKQDIINLLRFIDWLLVLPEKLEKLYWEELTAYREDIEMAPYRMLIEKEAEKKGLEKGLEQGLRQGFLEAIALGLEIKFGKDSLSVMPSIEEIESSATLEKLKDGLKNSASLEDFRSLYEKTAATEG